MSAKVTSYNIKNKPQDDGVNGLNEDGKNDSNLDWDSDLYWIFASDPSDDCESDEE